MVAVLELMVDGEGQVVPVVMMLSHVSEWCCCRTIGL